MIIQTIAGGIDRDDDVHRHACYVGRRNAGATRMIRRYGGGDTDETTKDALGFFVDGESILWSSDAYKFAFLLTDAPYKLDNRHGYKSLEYISEKLVQNGIQTSVIANKFYYEYYTPITNVSNGILANIYENFSKILKKLTERILGEMQKAKKAIYVLPGYLGSELYDKNSADANILWPDIRGIPFVDWMQREHVQLINRNADGSGEVAYALSKNVLSYSKDDYGFLDVYKKLVGKLKYEFDKSNGGDYDVKFFPYNWLGDLNQSVVKLEADALSYDKVVLVTHSTGGLLASAYMAKSRVNRLKVEKLVMIAPPLYGTYASLFPLERGDSAKGMNPIDFATNNKWVKQITHNSPTTYQLLPSREYFNTTPAFDQKTKDALLAKNQVWSYGAAWSEFYKTLNNSVNINGNLLSSTSNSRSHASFRENALTGGNTSIMDVLRLVDATVIGTVSGKATPRTAQYDISGGYDKAKLVDILYNMDGDGTVFNTSLGVTLDSAKNIKTNSLHTIAYKGSGSPNHLGLIGDGYVLNKVVELIKNAARSGGSGSGGDKVTSVKSAGGGATASARGAEADDTMEYYIKLYVQSKKNITIKIYDDEGELVAQCDAESKKGFDGQKFICDLFGEDGETIASILIPKTGYTARFYGDEKDAEAEMVVTVSILDADGDPAAHGYYVVDRTADGGPYARGYYVVDRTAGGGELLTLDMTGGVSFDNLDKLVSADDYPGL